MALADYQSLVTQLVRDDSGKIATTDRDEAIARAVARYSKDRPRLKVEDGAAPGGNKLNLPSAWQAGFSDLRAIEHPIGNTPPTLLDQDSYGIYSTPTADEIKIVSAINAAQQVRITYTIRHAVDAVPTDTIRADDREPVCCWAAALLCDQLAAYYSKSGNPTIQADSVDQRSKAQEYAARAKTLRKRYLDEIGVDEKKSVAAGIIVDLDMSDSQGRDRLLHPRRFR